MVRKGEGKGQNGMQRREFCKEPEPNHCEHEVAFISSLSPFAHVHFSSLSISLAFALLHFLSFPFLASLLGPLLLPVCPYSSCPVVPHLSLFYFFTSLPITSFTLTFFVSSSPYLSPLRFLYDLSLSHVTVLLSKVALTCACPREVAPYLTTEFYTEDYSVSQRVDMLEAISRAAITMSARHPTATAATAAASKAVASGADSGGPAPAQSLPPSRQDVVRARLEARTRRFHRPRPAAPTPAPPNAFTAVAGLFFFPLLNGHDAKLRTFQPMVWWC